MLTWTRFAVDVIKTNFEALEHPYRYFLVVTKSCQSRCQNCKIWQEKPTDELSLEEITKLAKNSPTLKWLNISGGEPTDRVDLPAIAAAFKKHCPHILMINFTTNGLEPEKIAKMVKEIAELRYSKFVVNVSIDGPPKVHDALRGVVGNFNSAIQTLKLLRSIPHVESMASMTLFEKNKTLINETIAEIQKNIPDFSPRDMHLNIPHSSPHFYRNSELSFSSNHSLTQYIDSYKKSYPQKISLISMIENIFHKKSKTFFETGITPLLCSAMLSSVYISEKGQVYPCSIWDKQLGSLRESDFQIQKILGTQVSVDSRDQIKKNNCPQCWTPCEAFPTIMANLSKAL